MGSLHLLVSHLYLRKGLFAFDFQASCGCYWCFGALPTRNCSSRKLLWRSCHLGSGRFSRVHHYAKLACHLGWKSRVHLSYRWDIVDDLRHIRLQPQWPQRTPFLSLRMAVAILLELGFSQIDFPCARLAQGFDHSFSLSYAPKWSAARRVPRCSQVVA